MDHFKQEALRLVSELIDAAHGTVLNEDQSREDEARAALLAHIERGRMPDVANPAAWAVSGQNMSDYSVWLKEPDEEQLEIMSAQCKDGPIIVRPLVFAAPAAPDHSAAKCDGNHAGPRCADPECWNDPIDDVIDVRTAAERLIKRALAVGVVLTIKTQPRQQLAMGNFDLVVETREVRNGGAA